MNPIASVRARAVFFDLDGTLADTAPDMAGALNELRRQEGLDSIPFERIRPYVSHGARALVQLGFAEVDESRFERLRQRFLNVYQARLTRETRLYEGVIESLHSLQTRGIPWGVVTNKPRGLTEPLLQELGVAQNANVVVSGDTLALRKPHPAPLLHAAERLGVAAGECIYIGDAERDVQAARAAGMEVFVALYGYIPLSEQPRSWPATGWLESPHAMAALLRSIHP